MNSQECKQLLADHCEVNHKTIARKWKPRLDTEDMFGFMEPKNWTRTSKEKVGSATVRTFRCKQGARMATLNATITEHASGTTEIKLTKWSWGPQ